MKISLALMKQFPSFLSKGKFISCSSIKGGLCFLEKGEYGPLKHWGWTCSTWQHWDHCRLLIVWPSTWVSSFSPSNLFPYIIMTQRRVITLQTPFGWILMRDLNRSDKWEPSAWLGSRGGGMRNLSPSLACALSWRSLCVLKAFKPEQTHAWRIWQY